MYKKLYKDIIDNAKLENRIKNEGTYYESHHIVPDFLFKHRTRKGPAGHLEGNANAKDNLVLLTFQEHLMAHYYLYETLKDTRYGYPAGTALQFFFVKAVGGHARHRALSDVDEQFLNEMAHLREIGIKSISNARKGKMPVVDAVTREKIGSMPVDHPNVLSGKWVHHSTGKKSPNSGRCQQGSMNGNYKEMTDLHIARIFKCISRSLVDTNHLSNQLFTENLKSEFNEFKKISMVWIKNNFGSLNNLVDLYNQNTVDQVEYNPYYRSISHRLVASKINAGMCWITNGIINDRIKKDDLALFLSINTEYKNGRTDA